jgi:glutathione S-transferase
VIYHVASAGDWREALEAGEYRVSTRGRTLEEEGFIHCSRASQVAWVANRFYRGAAGLVLLAIDPARLRSELRYEAVPGCDEPFPHLHGPLNTDAVVRVTPFERGRDGAFAFDGEAPGGPVPA